MKALIGVLLALVFATSVQAQTWGYHTYGRPEPGPHGNFGSGGGGQPPTNPVPTLQDVSVNMGALTRAHQGAVPPDLMYANGSQLATSWTICQATGTAGWFEIRIPGSVQTQTTITTCPTTVTWTTGNGFIVAPTTTAAAADLGGNSNSAALATFTVVGVNSSGNSVSHTLTINRKANGANISQAIAPDTWPWKVAYPGTPTGTSLFVGDSVGGGGICSNGNCFQAFVSACRPNCYIAFSTGTLGSNPNNATTQPNQPSTGTGFIYQINGWNYGENVFQVTGGAPAANEYLTWEDADSITDGGTPTGTSRHSLLDGLEFNGTNPTGHAGTDWTCTHGSWGAATISYMNVYDLSFGGNPLSNPGHSNHNGGAYFTAVCNSKASYLFLTYPVTRDANYQVTQIPVNPFIGGQGAFMFGNENLNISADHITCVGVQTCIADIGSNAGSGCTAGVCFSNGVTLSHIWTRYFGQHAISVNNAANVTLSDCYIFSAFQSPYSVAHIDYIQTADDIITPNFTQNRCMVIGADANAYGLAEYPGHTDTNATPHQGWKYNWVIIFDKEYAGFDVLGADNLTTRQAEFQYITIVRENYVTNPADLTQDSNYTVGLNVGNMNAGISFFGNINPSDGDNWQITKCTLDSTVPISAGSGCGANPVTTFATITFKNTVSDPTSQIQIGPHLCNATTNLPPCDSNSTMKNMQAALGTADTLTGLTCPASQAGPLGGPLGICELPATSANGNNSTSIIMDAPCCHPGNLQRMQMVATSAGGSIPTVLFGNQVTGNYPTYPVTNPAFMLEQADKFDATGCNPASNDHYCGQFHMNSIFVWDSIFPCPTSSVTTACSNYTIPSILAAGLLGPIASIDNVPGTSTANVYIVGAHCGQTQVPPTMASPCPLGSAIGGYLHNFTADGTSGAEGNAESHPYTFYQAMGAKTLVNFFAGLVCPVTAAVDPSAHLDIKGDGSTATGALDFSCNWNGFGQAPGYDLVNDAVNPWPH